MKKLIFTDIPELDLENPLGDYIFKIETSPYKQVEQYFEGYKELVFFKIRPITQFYQNNTYKFENAWFYNDGRKAIDNYLEQNCSHETSGNISRGGLDIYSVQGINFASVSFDTGPEFIFDLPAFISNSSLSEKIIDLVKIVLTSSKVNNNCKAISFELRAIAKKEVEVEKTIIQISEFPTPYIEAIITDVEHLITKTLYHTQYKKLARKY